MFNHAPENYKCPICLAVNGTENEDTMIKQDDIIYRNKYVMVLINSKFVDSNPGHIIVVPLKHFENIYDLPNEELEEILKTAKIVAIALKEVRNCDGVMLEQNNEPASGQHAFHFHLHLFPRFSNDYLHEHMNEFRVSTPEERKPYSFAMKEYFETNSFTGR